MTDVSRDRALVLEIERVQTIRRRVETLRGFCEDCGGHGDFADLADLARVFDVSVAEAVIQLRRRRIHMQHLKGDAIVVCAQSLLGRSDTESPLLCKSLPPSTS